MVVTIRQTWHFTESQLTHCQFNFPGLLVWMFWLQKVRKWATLNFCKTGVMGKINLQRLLLERHPVVQIKSSFVGLKCRHVWHRVFKSLLVLWVPADEWTLPTKAAFAVQRCYFWIFLIMSQHKFGYIIVMYSGVCVCVSARLVNTNLVTYPDDSQYWPFSSTAP